MAADPASACASLATLRRTRIETIPHESWIFVGLLCAYGTARTGRHALRPNAESARGEHHRRWWVGSLSLCKVKPYPSGRTAPQIELKSTRPIRQGCAAGGVAPALPRARRAAAPGALDALEGVVNGIEPTGLDPRTLRAACYAPDCLSARRHDASGADDASAPGSAHRYGERRDDRHPVGVTDQEQLHVALALLGERPDARRAVPVRPWSQSTTRPLAWKLPVRSGATVRRSRARRLTA
jgi:hypothetical protein